MSEAERELYRIIFDRLRDHLEVDTDDQLLIITQLTAIIGPAVQEHMAELFEAIHHLQETVRRLNA